MLGSVRLHVLRQLHDIRRCLRLLGDTEAAKGRPYERVVHTRLEYVWLRPHPPLALLSRHAVWVPSGEDYVPPVEMRQELGGTPNWHCITERHVVFPSALATPVLAVLPWILTNARFHSKVDAHGLFPNPECAIGTAWWAAGVWRRVRRFPRTMFAVRRAGLEARNWRHTPEPCKPHAALTRQRPRLFPKYCSEQWKAEAGCRELQLVNNLKNATPTGRGSGWTWNRGRE